MRALVAAVFVLTLLMSCSLAAHQQKEAYTTILFNQRAETLEIHHRFYLHDAEHALKESTGESLDLSHDAASQQRFADYLVSHFKLKVDELDLRLEVVGFETEGKYFWVYQETSLPVEIDSLHVAMSALQEVWASQINHINVERNGRVSSARLSADDGLKKIILASL